MFSSKCSAQNVQLKMFWTNWAEHIELNILSWTFWAERFELNILDILTDWKIIQCSISKKLLLSDEEQFFKLQSQFDTGNYRNLLSQFFDENFVKMSFSKNGHGLSWTELYCSKCLTQNVQLKMFSSKCSAQNVQLRMFSSKCSAQNVQLKMFSSKCSAQNVLNKLSRT